jgi:hypothetical protein
MRWILVFGLLVCSAGNGLAQPQTQFNVKNYGAIGDGIHLDTEAINKAIQAACDTGGGTVFLPGGKYLSGTVVLQNNVTLWIDSGATLLGSTNLADYRAAAGAGGGARAGGGRGGGGQRAQPHIVGNGLTNIAIMGRGTIDGQNLTDPNGEENIRGPHAVSLSNCKDVVIRDLTIKDAGNYNLIIRGSQRLTIDNLTALGGYDGINMHNTRDSTISNCKLYTGDDSLAGANWENVTVCNCLFNSSCNAIRTGGRNVLINNCLIYGPGLYAHRLGFRHNTESGFQVLPSRGSSIDNMVLSDITMINVRSPVYVATSTDAPYSDGSTKVGRIIFDNLTVINCGRTPFYISAPANNTAKSIILRNVRMSFVGGVEQEEQSNGQGFSPYGMLQAYGIYCRSVDNLELHDVRVDYNGKDQRPALYGENIGTLELDRFAAKRAADSPPMLMFAGIGKLIMNGAEVKPVKVLPTALDAQSGGAIAGEPFFVSATVQNTGPEGLGELELKLGSDSVKRSVWLGANETTSVHFLNLRSREAGTIPLQLGELARSVSVRPKPSTQPVSAPYRSFQNLQGQVQQIEGGFYVKEAGTYAVLDHGDQYGTAYLPQGLGETNSAIVRLENADSLVNWIGRVGLMVRKDITKPGQSPGYLAFGVSPGNGPSLEWDSNGDGVIDKRTELDGYSNWPGWLKLERQGTRFTGYTSKDGSNWSKIGEADVPGAEGALDVGVFAHRSSARFLDFKVVQ